MFVLCLVPSVGPNIIQWELDSVKQDEAFIEWDHIPEDKINGYLTGYVVFYGLSRDGTLSIAYPEFKNITVSFFHKLTKMSLKKSFMSLLYLHFFCITKFKWPDNEQLSKTI